MAEDSTAALAASVLPETEVELNKTDFIAPAASASTKPTESVENTDETKPTDTEESKKTPTRNGDAAQPAKAEDSTTEGKPDEAPAEDVEMKDADAAEEDAADDKTQATPASGKKTPNGSSKKKSTAVPEHKSKKLNRKKSKPTLRLDAKPGELYLARMKGHQPWPSIICDEEMLPTSLLNTRPVTTALPDGSFKKSDYAPGGKRENERTFPIMFLHTNEFAWLPNTELTPLDPEDCKDVPEKGKSKGLIEAYKVASEGNGLAYYKGVLIDHQAALEEDLQQRAEREAKKADKANKAKRKSEAAVVDEDEMDVDEEGEDPKPKSKKRKKSINEEDPEEKPAKTPKTGAKLKLTTPKTPTVELTSSKKKTPKAKASAKKSGAKAANSDDDGETPKVEEKTLTPAEARDKKEKEIRYYRHKLQKGFITRDYTPGEEEIKSMSTYLQKLENYPDLEGSIIRLTKINKVLKAMIRLPTIPKDEEFNFKKRAQDLLGKWNIILGSDTAGADKDDKEGDKDIGKDTDKEEAKEESKPETNGVKESEPQSADEDKTEEPKADAPTEPTLPKETKPSASDGTKIGTTVEGEKEADTEPTEPAEPPTDAKTDEPDVEKPAEAYKAPSETAEATA